MASPSNPHRPPETITRADPPQVARGQRVAGETQVVHDEKGQRVAFRLPLNRRAPPHPLGRPAEPDELGKAGPEDAGDLAAGPSVWEARNEDD